MSWRAAISRLSPSLEVPRSQFADRRSQVSALRSEILADLSKTVFAVDFILTRAKFTTLRCITLITYRFRLLLRWRWRWGSFRLRADALSRMWLPCGHFAGVGVGGCQQWVRLAATWRGTMPTGLLDGLHPPGSVNKLIACVALATCARRLRQNVRGQH